MADNVPNLHDCLSGPVCSTQDIEQFLRIGFSINSHSSYYAAATPLHHAVKNENCSMDIIKYLIDKKADISARDIDGLSPLHYLGYNFRKDAIDVARLLLVGGAAVDDRDRSHRTTLHLAVGQPSKFKDLVEFLIDHNASIHAKCRYGNTALHYACQEGDFDIIKLLLDRGANVHERSNNNRLPLHYAVRCLKPRVIKLLLKHGAQVNVVDEDDLSPLYLATTRVDMGSAKILLDCGALMSYGMCPLLAAYRMNIRVEAIVNRGRSIPEGFPVLFRKHMQLLLKYAFLEDDILHLETEYRMSPELSYYKTECLREISAMKSTSVDNTNLGQFVFQLRQEMKHKQPDEINCILNKLLYFIQCTNAFPIYKEVIAGVMNRDHLEAYQENQVVYTVPERVEDGVYGCQNRVILPIDELHIVTKYLTDLDLLNLTLAFYNSVD